MAINAFGEWKRNGLKVNAEGNPQLTKAAAIAIVKVLMPRITPKDKLGEYTSMKACVAWLGNVAGGTTWDAEMETVTKEYGRAMMERAPRLF